VLLDVVAGLAAAHTQGVRLVVALSERGGTLRLRSMEGARCSRASWGVCMSAVFVSWARADF